MVVIIDYGVGNLMAIQNIIRKMGGDAVISAEKVTIQQAERIILPGVGSFGYCMDQLNSRDLVPVLKEEVLTKKKNVLGLCVGAQMMTQKSEEGGPPGLGWVEAVTRKFDEAKVPVMPHMGWSDVWFENSSPLVQGLEKEARFYFVHSYHFEFTNPGQVVGRSHFGYDFPCIFQNKNIFGVQFHPEKSHRFGMKLFENFLKL